MRPIVLTFFISAALWLISDVVCLWGLEADATLSTSLLLATLVAGCVAFIVAVILAGALLGEGLTRLFASKDR